MESIFSALDRSNNGVLDFKEFVSGLSVLLRGSRADWAEFEFNVWDTDKNGTLSLEEFTRYLRCTQLDSTLSEEKHAALAQDAFQMADRDGSGSIDLGA